MRMENPETESPWGGGSSYKWSREKGKHDSRSYCLTLTKEKVHQRWDRITTRLSKPCKKLLHFTQWTLKCVEQNIQCTRHLSCLCRSCQTLRQALVSVPMLLLASGLHRHWDHSQIIGPDNQPAHEPDDWPTQESDKHPAMSAGARWLDCCSANRWSPASSSATRRPARPTRPARPPPASSNGSGFCSGWGWRTVLKVKHQVFCQGPWC